MTQQARIRQRSTDVFRDLAFSPAEAEDLRIRSAMMRALIGFIRERKLTPERAARLLGVSRPLIAGLIAGQIDRFSIDDLIKLLVAAGLRVDLRVKRVA